jgi:hypothetical protein
MNNAYCDCKVKNICELKIICKKLASDCYTCSKIISQVIIKCELFSCKIDYNLDVKKFKAQKG